MSEPSNHFTSWIENNYGQIEFGRLDPDHVRAAVYLANKQDVRHRFYMDIDRDMGGGTHSVTTLESPGGVIIKCGQDRKRPDVTFNIQVENGKLALTCQTGDVLVQGKNVVIEAKGDGNNDGNITLKSNSKIDLQSPKIEINGKQKVGCYSEQKIDVQSQGTLQMYGAQASCQSASSRYGQRGTSQEAPITPED
tara:strand:- start:14 stop:595 length:582 start_codon:yes stop_codon:yes gene_type:complete